MKERPGSPVHLAQPVRVRQLRQSRTAVFEPWQLLTQTLQEVLQRHDERGLARHQREELADVEPLQVERELVERMEEVRLRERGEDEPEPVRPLPLKHSQELLLRREQRLLEVRQPRLVQHPRPLLARPTRQRL